MGDEDDKDIGDGPEILTGAIPELYLINPVTKERTFFRWNYKQETTQGAPTCNMSTGSGCLGNIQILKLRGKDIGYDHTGSTSNSGTFDGIIDTWVCHPSWKCTGVAISSL